MKIDMEDIIKQANDITSSNVAAYKQGEQYAELRHRTIMRAVASAYEQAKKDPHTVIPTSLAVMLDSIVATVAKYPPAANV